MPNEDGSATAQATIEAELERRGHRRCRACHRVVDIPLDLAFRLDSGVFQGGSEVSMIDLNEPWTVNVYWSLTGGLARSICVNWCVVVKFESMGPGSEFEEPLRVIETQDCDATWSMVFNGSDYPIEVTERECSDVYRLVAVVTARDKCEGTPVGITGFCDLGLVEFYAGATQT